MVRNNFILQIIKMLIRSFQLDITLSMSSSTETESAERDTNQNSKPDDGKCMTKIQK